MKIISIILMLIGLYLMINPNSSPEKSQKQHNKIQYKEKHKDIKIERLVEIVDPEYDIKHPKSN